MFLQADQTIIHHILNNEAEPSSIYLWITIGVAVVLFVFFLYRTNKIIDGEKSKEETVPQSIVIQEVENVDHEIHEEEAAAIALALYMYKKEIDRKEHFKTTLQRVSKVYSPWNSKIYTLRQNPRG